MSFHCHLITNNYNFNAPWIITLCNLVIHFKHLCTDMSKIKTPLVNLYLYFIYLTQKHIPSPWALNTCTEHILTDRFQAYCARKDVILLPQRPLHGMILPYCLLLTAVGCKPLLLLGQGCDVTDPTVPWQAWSSLCDLRVIQIMVIQCIVFLFWR